MPEAFKVPLKNRVFRRLARPVFRGIFHILSPVIISGRENVPQHGAYLIVFNHVSLYDGPFVLAFWPMAPEVVGAVDIWHRKGQSTLAEWYKGIPVRRGEYNRQAIQTLLAVLNSGRPLVIAPEGGRSHDLGMRRGHPGVGYLIEKAGVPVIPVGVIGATDDFFSRAIRGGRPVLEMHIGQPIKLTHEPDLGNSPRKSWQNTTDLIMAHVADLLPAEYRGVYAEYPSLTPQTAQ